MKKSTLLKIFNTLSKKDIRELRKFVRSPFFNQRADVIALYEYLATAKITPEASLEKIFVYAQLFRDQPYDDERMRLIMFFLKENIKRYLTYTTMLNDNVQQGVYLCKALRQKGLDQAFEKELKKNQQLQQKSPHRNIRFHYHNYQLSLERYEQDHKNRRSGEMNLQGVSDELTTFYIADILRHSCTILTHQSMSKQNYQLPLLEAVLQQVEKGDYEYTPAVVVYYHAYKALSAEDNSTHFLKLRSIIATYWTAFSPTEIRDIYLLAINYCIRQLNKGKKAFIKEAFELYQAGLKQKILLEDQVLSKFTYNNVMMLGLALDEWDWVFNFLEQYKQFLPNKERENVYRYNQAIYFFRKPDYDQAMRLLQRVEFRDVQYNLNARRMLLRMYYELKEFEALESLLDSFRTYIHRQKDLGYHREHYLNLIAFVKKMLRSNLKDPKFKAKIKKEVDAASALAEKSWLLEQLQ